MLEHLYSSFHGTYRVDLFSVSYCVTCDMSRYKNKIFFLKFALISIFFIGSTKF